LSQVILISKPLVNFFFKYRICIKSIIIESNQESNWELASIWMDTQPNSQHIYTHIHHFIWLQGWKTL